MRLDRLHKPRRSISEKQWGVSGQAVGGPSADPKTGQQQQISPKQQKLVGILQSIAYQQGLPTTQVKKLIQDIYSRLSYGRQMGYNFLRDGKRGDTAVAKLGNRKVNIELLEQAEKGTATVSQILQAIGFRQSTMSQIMRDYGLSDDASYNIGPISQYTKEPATTGQYRTAGEPIAPPEERKFKYRGPKTPTKMKAAKAAAKKRKPEPEPQYLLGPEAPSEPEQRGVIDPDREIAAEPEVAAEPAAEPVAAPVKAKAKPKKRRKKAAKKAPVEEPAPASMTGIPDPDAEAPPGEEMPGSAAEKRKVAKKVFGKVAKLVKSGITAPEHLGKAIYGDKYNKKKHAGVIARAAKKALAAEKEGRLAVKGGRAKVGEVGAKKKKRKRKPKKEVTTDDIIRRIADLIDEDEIF